MREVTGHTFTDVTQGFLANDVFFRVLLDTVKSTARSPPPGSTVALRLLLEPWTPWLCLPAFPHLPR